MSILPKNTLNWMKNKSLKLLEICTFWQVISETVRDIGNQLTLSTQSIQ
jgi:hypothetical protein